MKKLITFCITVLLSGTLLFGQDMKNEITVSYSQATLPQTAYLLGGVFGTIFTLGHFQFDNTLFLGALGVEYAHNVNDWFSYGGVATIDYMTSDAYTVDSDGNRTDNGKFNLGWASLMPIVKFTWLNHPKFDMYSKLGAGVGLAFNDGEGVSFSAQVSPVCMQFGGGKIRGVLEFGYGMQGIATVGIKRMF